MFSYLSPPNSALELSSLSGAYRKNVISGLGRLVSDDLHQFMSNPFAAENATPLKAYLSHTILMP